MFVNNKKQMFPSLLKSLREKGHLPQREVASALEIVVTNVPQSPLKVEFEHIYLVLLEMLTVGLFGMIAEPDKLSKIHFIHNNIKN